MFEYKIITKLAPNFTGKERWKANIEGTNKQSIISLLKRAGFYILQVYFKTGMILGFHAGINKCEIQKNSDKFHFKSIKAIVIWVSFLMTTRLGKVNESQSIVLKTVYQIKLEDRLSFHYYQEKTWPFVYFLSFHAIMVAKLRISHEFKSLKRRNYFINFEILNSEIAKCDPKH